MDDDNKNINSDIDENDSVIESDDIVSEEDENTPRLIAKLREKLKECESEKQENLNGWQRTKADFVNLKKRSEEENREFIKYANNRLIEEIIPVLESFEMAFSNKKVWESLPEQWRKGVEYINNQLLGVLKGNGLEELNPLKGTKFDPSIHVAESSAETFDKKEDNVIIQIIKKGYALNGKIIIPPKVVVAEYKEGAESEGLK
ncbi:MAG: nucleotide exchange factor GrpE [Patescibacteria group bacterium]